MLSLVFNINHGPWKSAGWLAQLSQAQVEYFSRFDGPYCDLFTNYLPDIAKDLGREDELHKEGFAEEIWEATKQSPKAHLKGPTVQLCRWYSWVHCWKYWRKAYHTRLLIMLYWAMGWGC